MLYLFPYPRLLLPDSSLFVSAGLESSWPEPVSLTWSSSRNWCWRSLAPLKNSCLPYDTRPLSWMSDILSSLSMFDLKE